MRPLNRLAPRIGRLFRHASLCLRTSPQSRPSQRVFIVGAGLSIQLSSGCYRRRRELDWFAGELLELSRTAGVLTTSRPLHDLCGIAKPGSGWRVFRFVNHNWECMHSGNSEAEARWNYEHDSDGRAQILLDPVHQIVDSSVAESRALW